MIPCCLSYFVYSITLINDLGSAETVDKASFSFNTLRAILIRCGTEGAKNKACPPRRVIIFIGILFSTVKMTIEGTPERIHEINFLLNTRLNKEIACLKAM